MTTGKADRPTVQCARCFGTGRNKYGGPCERCKATGQLAVAAKGNTRIRRRWKIAIVVLVVAAISTVSVIAGSSGGNNPCANHDGLYKSNFNTSSQVCNDGDVMVLMQNGSWRNFGPGPVELPAITGGRQLVGKGY